ncbi:MAG: hypothetical protein VXY63_03270 [Pseudomonadota bacterium]|nr:hypothetical protein [Pseudomonadota bacterium]
MLRVVWLIILAPLLVVVLRLTALDPNAEAISCLDAQSAFEVQDFSASLPANPALIIGNQRVKYWTETPNQLGAAPVLKRTIGGLQPHHLDECFPRLIGHYQPGTVFLLLDTEHLMATPSEDLLDALQGIMEQRSVYGLRFELAVIAPITSPIVSASDRGKFVALKNELKDWSARTLGTRYLSVDGLYTGDNGEVSPDYFWPNGNTLTNEGYVKLTNWLVALSNERKKEFTGIVSK